jgi:SNF2 family DNA or RNA helicase
VADSSAQESGPVIHTFDLTSSVQSWNLPEWEYDLRPAVRVARLLSALPWVHSASKLQMTVSTEGWRFPTPPGDESQMVESRTSAPFEVIVPPTAASPNLMGVKPTKARATRLHPPTDAIVFKDRLFYLLQPPLENLFLDKQVRLPMQPYPYQLEGIAFLMPRHAALLADEMGLGKTMQAILSLRLLFQAGLICNALLICPKPLVPNWCKELRMWAADLPFEVIGGDVDARRSAWQVSNCPLKLVNYEILTRDAALVRSESVRFDVVVLDEAQRIKNRNAKTAQVVRSLRRERSWALTGTPIENRPEDLVNLFAFVDPPRIPPETPVKHLAQLTADCILRRTKEDVLSDLPPKTIRDAFVELTPAQRTAYDLAESEGVVRLNTLGDTVTVQHVFELVLRLKQICNFDPLTRQSAKLEQLAADLAEVAESGRKAIVFSQWVEPLEWLARVLADLGPVQYHGKIPARDRHTLLDRFRKDPSKHVILMSYGTGSVGLNLQFTNYVFLFDRWWNPAVEDQAINRAHRIGQRNPVFVTRFITPDTIEGRIAEVLERKRQLFNELIEQNEPPPQIGLTEAEIFGLFNIAYRPRRASA